jgi:hypothetical protein
MSDDTLRQIEAVLSLAESDTELSDAEKVNLLASTGRKLLQAMATERKRAEAAEDELARQSAYSTQLEQDRDVSVSRFKRILDEQQALRESIATLESQLANANGRAQILAAQLGGWEAACASQVKAARIYLDATADMAHNGPQIAARGRLANAIDSNAGQFLLARLQPADELADAVEQEHEMRRAAELDPARGIDLAAASYRLGIALAAYRKAQKARGQ